MNSISTPERQMKSHAWHSQQRHMMITSKDMPRLQFPDFRNAAAAGPRRPCAARRAARTPQLPALRSYHPPTRCLLHLFKWLLPRLSRTRLRKSRLSRVRPSASAGTCCESRGFSLVPKRHLRPSLYLQALGALCSRASLSR